MELVTSEQFTKLEQEIRDHLDEAREDREELKDGWPSELLFLCDVWAEMQELFFENGITDDFVFKKVPGKSGSTPPTIEDYNEEKVTAFGQLIGDLIIAINPAMYASPNPEQPFSDVLKFKNREQFIFQTLPPLDQWKQGWKVNARGEWKMWTYRFNDDVWFELYEEDPEDDGNMRYFAQLCVPKEPITMKGTTARNWFLLGYADTETERFINKESEKYYHTYPLMPCTTAYDAWLMALDYWQGIAYRYL